MKEYKVVSTADAETFPYKKGLFSNNEFETRILLFEQYLNDMANEGWRLISTSSYWGVEVFIGLALFLERDKPEGEPTEPSQD